MTKIITGLILIFCVFSQSSQAADTLEVGGKKYALSLQEIKCITGADDLFNPANKIVFDEMKRAGCSLQSQVDASINCSNINESFLLRSYILQETRNRNYCSCISGPAECTSVCIKSFSKEECQVLCSGSCTAYPKR